MSQKSSIENPRFVIYCAPRTGSSLFLRYLEIIMKSHLPNFENLNEFFNLRPQKTWWPIDTGFEIRQIQLESDLKSIFDQVELPDLFNEFETNRRLNLIEKYHEKPWAIKILSSRTSSSLIKRIMEIPSQKILLTREDRTDHILSWFYARKTGFWNFYPEPETQIEFDRIMQNKFSIELEEFQLINQMLLDFDNQLSYLPFDHKFTYEELISQPEKVFEKLNLETSFMDWTNPGVPLPKKLMSKQEKMNKLTNMDQLTHWIAQT